MPIIGQTRPNTRRPVRRPASRAALIAALCIAACSTADSAEIDVRLRFAWGAGGEAPQAWRGSITVPGAKLTALQPLGVEPDEAAAVRLVDDSVVVAPLVRRAFDGCDVTVRGDEAALVKVELQYAANTPAKPIEIPLGKLADEPFRAPLDDLGGDLIVHRAPGDRMRVRLQHEHLVFAPEETVKLKLTPDLAAADAGESLTVRAGLYRTGASDVLWERTVSYEPASAEPIALELPAPKAEGAYRVALTIQPPAGIARRLVPWDKSQAVASREIEFVVVDPAARLPRLADEWEVVSQIAPASSPWWQRAPQWTQFDKLPGFSTPRPLGNARPTPVAGSSLGLVELPAQPPAPSDGADPSWQAYLLAVRRVGEPHAVEIEIPRGHRQHLAVSIVEPDAAGRVHSFGRDCGVYVDQGAVVDGDAPGVEVHRVVFWPRTKSPALLLANRDESRSIQYGNIRLLRRATVPAPAPVEPAAAAPAAERLVAAYIASPRLADTFGAAEEYDAASGMSVEGWGAFLAAANRLAQQLHASGYNAAIIAVAADGASLAPIDALGASPRYDAGPLAAAALDPLRKDVLEVLLRVFDREGLKLIPAVQLAAPLPGLEQLAAPARATPAAAAAAGATWIGRDGRSWAEHYPAASAAAAGPHYNLLHPAIQGELTAMTDQLLARYGDHPAFAGLALQLDGLGYGVLPGLAWGLDDVTVARFAQDAHVELPASGDDRFARRAELLQNQHADRWSAWRKSRLTEYYAGLAERVASRRPELQLVLCTESLFNGPVATERLRHAVGGRASLGDALDELGVDVAALAAAPGVAVLRPRRLAAEQSVDARALDLRLNAAAELDSPLTAEPRSGELLFHASRRLRLPSFDAQSPFGADATALSLASPSTPVGQDACAAMAAALAGRDVLLLADGGETLPLVHNPAHIAALRVLQELPSAAADVRTERRQPVTLRVYRESNVTTVCLVNESRWPCQVAVPLECDGDLVWRRLGVDDLNPPSTASSSAADVTGTLPRGSQTWTVALPAYGVEARRFSSRSLHVGAIAPQIPDEARASMNRRIADIQDRMDSLNVERAYNQLENPSFESVADGGRLIGWQPRIGARGAVEVDAEAAQPGGRSVRLRSEDALGVAVQSHLFAIPATGELTVRAKVRAAELAPGAQLYAWIEYESAGVMRQRYVALGGGQPLPDAWTDCEFAVDDLPLASADRMRVQFHLVGAGEAWIDDVRLYDLRFAAAERVELSKRLLGAKAALEEGHLIDCQRLVDGYLPRRLVESIPPPALAAATDAPTTPPAAAPTEEPDFRTRLRGIVPKILR